MTEYPDVEYNNEKGDYAETFELPVYCPCCSDGIDSSCDYCGEQFKFGEKIICRGWIDNMGENGTDADGEHIHLTCWYVRIEEQKKPYPIERAIVDEGIRERGAQ